MDAIIFGVPCGISPTPNISSMPTENRMSVYRKATPNPQR